MTDSDMTPTVDPEELKEDIIPLTADAPSPAEDLGPEPTSDNPFGLEHPESVEEELGGTAE